MSSDYRDGRGAKYPDYDRPEHVRGYQDAHNEQLRNQQDARNEQRRAEMEAQWRSERESSRSTTNSAEDAALVTGGAFAIGIILLLILAVIAVALAWVLIALLPVLAGAALLSSGAAKKSYWGAVLAVLASCLGVLAALYGPTFMFGDSLMSRIAGTIGACLCAVLSGWLIRRWIGRVGLAASLLAALLILGTVSAAFGSVFMALRYDLTGRILREVIPGKIQSKLNLPPVSYSSLPFDRWISSSFVEAGRTPLWDAISRDLGLEKTPDKALEKQAEYEEGPQPTLVRENRLVGGQVWKGALICPKELFPFQLTINVAEASGEISATLRVGRERDIDTLSMKGNQVDSVLVLTTTKVKVKAKNRVGMGDKPREVDIARPYDDIEGFKGQLTGGTTLDGQSMSAHCKQFNAVLVE